MPRPFVGEPLQMQGVHAVCRRWPPALAWQTQAQQQDTPCTQHARTFLIFCCMLHSLHSRPLTICTPSYTLSAAAASLSPAGRLRCRHTCGAEAQGGREGGLKSALTGMAREMPLEAAKHSK